MQVRASVKVTNPKHKRTGQAGVVQSMDENAGTASVKFDVPPDGEPETVKVVDLVQLGDNN